MKIMSNNRLIIIMIICILILGLSSHIFSDDMNKKEDTEYEWGPESENYQLSIQAGKKVYTYCEPIVLKVTIRNNSAEPGLLIVSRPDKDYKAIVKNSKEKAIPLTAYGRHLRDSLLGGLEQALYLDPGQKLEYTLLVNRIHDMTRKDTYSIVVKRYVYKRNDKGSAEVVSNTIEVGVKGDPPNPFEDSKSE